MYIIVGLGNPKTEYKNTRHNAGFDVIDVLADQYDIVTDFKKHMAFCGKGYIEGERVVLAMPQTYMNLSGESVRALVDFYKIDVERELIVIYDDISLDVGQIRIRKKGSAGGHNGMKNIIMHLKTEQFMRIRVGVGDKPKGYDLADYVLGHFSASERELMDTAFINATQAIKTIITENVDVAMNRFNSIRGEKE
ncbi:MAG: aminoacyl-tRNA hydrolase [Clostridia bacterium]|nr:aminoacyl-tRNA hydrolase [Clostridia bacterium]